MNLGRGLSILALAAACGCSKRPPPPTEWHTESGRPFAERTANTPGIENFATVKSGICRGGQPNAEGYQYLKAQGFKTVVSLRQHHDEGKEVEAAGLKWVHIPLHADITGSTAPTEEEVHEFFDTVLDPANQPVYFHCAFGKDRTGTMAALYRIEMDGWTPEEALQEMEAFGMHTIYKTLREFVLNYKPRGFKAPVPK